MNSPGRMAVIREPKNLFHRSNCRRQTMNIEYQINHEQQLVLAKAQKVLAEDDIFNYQREVWSRNDVVGYNELLDLSEVERVELSSTDSIEEFARLAISMDVPTTATRFAIIAPTDLMFGLGRMYEAYRNLNEQSTKQACVFRSRSEALAWLSAKGGR
jgi:hypothetical protein